MKRRWKRYDGMSDKIYLIVKNNKDITTSRVLVKLKEQKIKVTWKLVDSYLTELEDAKKIKRVKIGDKHKINFWNIF